jgi:hypothetical protein
MLFTANSKFHTRGNVSGIWDSRAVNQHVRTIHLGLTFARKTDDANHNARPLGKANTSADRSPCSNSRVRRTRGRDRQVGRPNFAAADNRAAKDAVSVFRRPRPRRSFASGDERRRRWASIPRQGWWAGENFSEPQGPENLQNRSQPRQRPRFAIGPIAVRQPVSHAGERLAEKGKCWLGAVHTVGPAAKCGRIGHTVRVFERRHGLFPGAVLHKSPPQPLTTSQQAVLRVRE